MNRNELTIIIIVSGLLSISFPPFPLGFLVPPALALFMWFLNDKTPKDGFRLGYLLGLIWGAGTLFWIGVSTVTGAVITIIINALHYAIVWWIFCWVHQKNKSLSLWLFPFLWVAMEYLRNFSDVRFNWMSIAHTQTYFLHFAQFIEYTGMHGLSFLLAIFSVFIYLILTGQKKQRILFSSFIIIISLAVTIFGIIRQKTLDNQNTPLLKAAIVQPNVDPFEKWDPDFQKEAFSMLMDASKKLAMEVPDIIVWPETATPFYLRARFSALQAIYKFVDSTQIYLLTGTPDYEYSKDKKDYSTYNAAFFFKPNNKKYDFHYKITLVPATEITPFKEYLPFLKSINYAGGDYVPGDSFTVFIAKPDLPFGKFDGTKYSIDSSKNPKQQEVGISPIICYESVFPDLDRKFVLAGANIFTIVTNDGWFGTTSGPAQHAQFAVLRAIENRASIIRCANTGISGFIDPTGRYLQTAALNTRQNITQYLPVYQNLLTFYTKHGEWLGKLTVIVTLLIIFIKLGSSIFLERKSD